MSGAEVLSAIAACAACATAFFQWRSVIARREMAEWLEEHGMREEAATKKLLDAHEELTSAVRSATPTYVAPIGVPKE